MASKVVNVAGPLLRLPAIKFPIVELFENRLVLEAVVEKRVVEKKFVVVAEVPVALLNVKFWRVEEPLRRRLERLVSPPIAVRVVPIPTEPVKLATLEIVWPLIRPEVTGPTVRVPMLPLVEKRLVEVAVVEKRLVKVPFVEKKFVVVAEVPVAF